MMNAAINRGIPRFFFWVVPTPGALRNKLHLFVVETHPHAQKLPWDYKDDLQVKRRLYQSKAREWNEIEPDAERAERVCERLNRSTLAVAAAELERRGIAKLFKHCWEEDERDYG